MAFDREQREPRAPREDRGDKGAAAGAPFFRRKKTCPFSGKNGQKIDWKDTKTLMRYISERGKIMPARISAVSATKQRELAQAIKRARFMALMPYVRDELPPQRSFGDRPERGPRTDRSFGSFENSKEG